MYTNVSNRFIEKINGFGRTFKLRMSNNSGDVIDTGIISFDHIQESNNNGQFSIGGIVSGYAQVSIRIPDGGLNFSNEEYDFQLGLALDDDLTEFEYVPIGKLIPKNFQKNDYVVTFVAYDRMIRLDQPYESHLEYPCDIKMVCQEISAMSNVPIEYSGMPDFQVDKRIETVESTFDEEGEETQVYIYRNPFDGMTMRQALHYISQIFGRFAVADRDGVIRFKWYENVDYTVTASRYYDDLSVAENVFQIRAISCEVGEDTLISGTGQVNVAISNPYMTQERLDAIYNEIKDFQFLPSRFSFYGDIRLDFGDIIRINTKKGEAIPVPIMFQNLDWDGGVISSVASYQGIDTGDTEQKDMSIRNWKTSTQSCTRLRKLLPIKQSLRT